jgi:hypothetical protein
MIDFDSWLMSGPGGPDDDCPTECPNCGEYMSHDDEADFGCCETCHNAEASDERRAA